MKRSQRRSPRKRGRGPRIFFLTLVVLVLLLLNRQHLEDGFNLVPSAPSEEIAQLAQVTTMTPKAQRLFYRQKPRIEPRDVFLEQCESPEDIILLGCYIQHRLGDRVVSGRIIIQQIEDPQFQGILEVTAAHEMLHAAYDKLSTKEQNELSKPLQAAVERVTNPRLQRLLSNYEQGDRERYLSELHSHLGTELVDLGAPELEAHYQTYFRDRQRVVAFAQQSQQTLSNLDAEADKLLAEIEQLEPELERDRKQLERIETRLDRESRELEVLQMQVSQVRVTAETAIEQRRSDAESQVATFNRKKQTFNQKVDAYNDKVQAQRDRVEQFNQKVQDYQAKVDAYNRLAQENRAVLDSLRGIRPVNPMPSTALP